MALADILRAQKTAEGGSGRFEVKVARTPVLGDLRYYMYLTDYPICFSTTGSGCARGWGCWYSRTGPRTEKRAGRRYHKTLFGEDAARIRAALGASGIRTGSDACAARTASSDNEAKPVSAAPRRRGGRRRVSISRLRNRLSSLNVSHHTGDL